MTSAKKLLPEHGGDEFASPEYWKKFFAERRTPFEWYGDYDVLSSTFERYVKPSDKMLQIGCGNSQLASQMYDNGYRMIHSIDTNANVIKDQSVRNRRRSDLSFACSSATDTGLAEKSVNVVLDKGTLDALMPPSADEPTREVVAKMFEEVYRVLSPAGRYLIVTLAQEHIIEYWQQCLKDRFLLRVQKVENHASGFCMPIFVLIATKLMRPIKMPVEFCRGCDAKPERMSAADELRECIKAEQELSRFAHVCSKKLTEEVSIVISGHDGNPRYKFFIVDDLRVKHPRSYASFVVPIGRDGDWIFQTEKGRRSLRSQCRVDRLAVVALQRDIDYGSLEVVKTEVAPFVRMWAPHPEFGEIQYLSMGEVDVKRTVATGESEVNGKWAVEDVEIHGKHYRRLVFLSSQNLVQSEASLVYDSDGKTQVIDLDDLACEHHEMMLLSLSMMPSMPLLTPESAELRIAILGLGGGLLAAYVLKQLPKSVVTALELDRAVVDIASSYFDCPADDPRMTVKVTDALVFLGETAKGAASDKYDIILMDLAGPMHEDGLSCPPSVFLTEEALNNAYDSLNENGVLAMNLVTRDTDIADFAKAKVAHHFPSLLIASAEDDVNEVLLAPKALPDDYDPRVIAKQLKVTQPWLSTMVKCLQSLGSRSCGHKIE